MVLKGVYQFVPDNVTRGLVSLHYWHHHPVLQTLGNTAGTYANIAVNCCCLLKIGMIGIKNDRVRFPEGIPEHLLMYGVPQFAFLRKPFDQAVIFYVVIDLEMRGFINLEFQVFVTHFVLPKVLRIGVKIEKQGGYKAA